MKNYAEFCEHYEYEKDSVESKKLYAEYKLNFAIFEKQNYTKAVEKKVG